MEKRTWFLGLLALATILVGVLTTPRPAQANVTLIDFTASASASGVDLAWSTGTEFESAGFILKRAVDPNAFLPLYNDADVIAVAYEGERTSFIPAAGNSGTGATYAATDDAVEIGVVYWYRLIEIEINQNRIELETESVTAGVLPTATPTGPGFSLPPTATPTPSTSATSPTNTPPPTPTSNPTATARATQPNPTATPGTAPSIPPTTLATATSQPATAATLTPLPAAPTSVTENPPATVVVQALGAGGVEAAPAEQAYPAGTPTTDAAYEGAAPTPTDAAPLDSSAAEPTPIGSENVVATLPPPRDAATAASADGSRLILWGGFLAALVIFIAGVVGSVFMFNRRQP